MRIFLLAIALLASVGSAAATNDHGYIQLGHGTTAPGTDPYGCNGEPPAGCYDVYGFASYHLMASEDPNNVYAILCSVRGDPSGPPGPGVNVGAWRHNDSSSTGPSANVGACVGLWDGAMGFFLMGGQGVDDGASGAGAGYSGDAYIRPGEMAHVQFNEGGGVGSTGAGSWVQADLNEAGKCAGAGIGTNNGGINVGTFCF